MSMIFGDPTYEAVSQDLLAARDKVSGLVRDALGLTVLKDPLLDVLVKLSEAEDALFHAWRDKCLTQRKAERVSHEPNCPLAFTQQPEVEGV